MQIEAVALAAEVQLRPMVASDVNFILHSWLESYRKSPQVETVLGPVYFRQHHRLLSSLLPGCSVIVLANPEDLNQILGWACWQKLSDFLVLHYVYVKAPFRQLGLARTMVEFAKRATQTTGVHHSHSTRAGLRLARRLGSVFNPYLAFWQT